jgi:hypothetical protein
MTLDYLRLAIALLLPWAGGFFWLAAVEQRCNSLPPNRLRQLGYALFIGYAGVQGTVLAYNGLTGSVAFLPILSVIAVLTALGGALFILGRGKQPAPAAASTVMEQGSGYARLALMLFLAWACFHLLLSAVEIIYRPIFPWDAWLNWMYRAKAWFYAGAVMPMDAPADWLNGNITATYNVAGNIYPTFPSIMALWTALALGQWSETLVNLPVLCCGIALALGLYGQCRETGLPTWLAVTAVYLLLSIPLIGTHLSLAGQADIWMAGFTGLGLVTLISGQFRESPYHTCLGLLLLGLGIAVKNEGLVWFMAALLVLCTARWPRTLAAATGAAVVILGLAWILGISSVDLPLLGKLGIENSQVHIPLVGSYTLVDNELLDDYWANFFAGGSWHLLWPLVIAAVPALIILPAGPGRRSILALLAVLILTQLLIFEGTEQGEWAEQWTAINRLPMHFAPALVFALTLAANGLVSRQSDRDTPARALYPGIFLLGLLLPLVALTAYLHFSSPPTSGEAQLLTAKDLKIVVGEGRIRDDTGIVTGFSDKVAVLSSGNSWIDPEKFRQVSVDLAGSPRTQVRLFWRTAGGTDDLHFIELGQPAKRHLSLAGHPDWQGTIGEVGLVLLSPVNEPVEFTALELHPQTLTGSLRALWSAWTLRDHWTQRSAHFIAAGDPRSALPLPLAITGWWLFSTLLLMVLTRRAPGSGAAVVACALLAWAALDLRWSLNRIAQAAQTVDYYAAAPRDHLDMGNDQGLLALADTVKAYTVDSEEPVLIVAQNRSLEFEILRTKYHLLPRPALGYTGAPENAPADLGRHVIYLRRPAVDNAGSVHASRNLARDLEDWYRRPANIVYESPRAVLVALGEPGARE